MNFIGIDPGASGAVALLSDGVLKVWDIPTVQEKRGKRTVNKLDEEEFATLVDNVLPMYAVCYLEKVASMQDQGVASVFSFGEMFGAIKMALTYARISYKLIPPQTWKLAMGCGANKESSCYQCLQIWGDEYRDLWFGPRQGILDGRCEAALLAEYARRKTNGP